jgi:hypothetical protein
MKTKSTLSILMPLAVAAMVLVGCSDYDNGYTEKEMKFNADFSRQFGSFDETQDWNLAERANVTVTSSLIKDVNVYTEKEGIYVQVGAFKNVSGTRKLEFDVIEDMQNLVVSDGDVALRAVVGGVVDFDNMSSMTAPEMETRGGEYVDRNLWSRKYVVPANITEAESLAVVAEFSKQHYGAFNEVLVPWTELFVQQVHKGTARYYDAFNQQTGTASNKMNHLLIYDNSASEGAFNGSYIHVNDFNDGNQTTVAYDDKDVNKEHPIIGLTLMRGINPTGCPTEDFNFQGVDKHWVKQFCYHNAQSDEYQPTYIMKRVSWVEDGVTKSGLYLGFDFYAQKRPDQPADKNMDVERDWIFNDWIIKISQGLDVNVPVSELQNAEPAAWILAGEDLGGGFDIDYNDVVVKVVRLAGQNKVTVTPLAAGGTLASYLFFGKTCIGEIHQLLDQSPSISGHYQPINLDGDLKVATQQVEVHVAQDWGLSEDVSKANNMGGFTIRVLPAGTPAMAKVLNYEDEAFDKATDVNAPVEGVAPYILCVPFAYTLTNYPEVGQKMANVWSWPSERTYINVPYPEFEEWVKSKGSHKDWFSKPGKNGFVSTKVFTQKVLGVQPMPMTTHEIEATGNPNADVTFYNSILPSVYPVLAAPVATLELKAGQSSDIYVKENDVIDVLDYVNVTEAYKDKVFCVSGSTGAMAPVEGSFTKLKCVMQRQNSGTTTVNIRLATPDGVKNVDLTVHYNESGTTSADLTPSISLSESGIVMEAGTTKTVTINTDSEGALSVSTQGTGFLEVSLDGKNLTIKALKQSGDNVIITQQADATHQATTQYIWIGVTGEVQPEIQEGTTTDSSTTDGGGTSYSISGKQTNCVFSIETASDGKYNVKYDGADIFTGISQLTFNWTGNYQPVAWGGNAGSININSPWSTVLQQLSNTAQGSYSVNLSSAFKEGEARTITFSNNNSGSSFNLEVTGQ